MRKLQKMNFIGPFLLFLVIICFVMISVTGIAIELPTKGDNNETGIIILEGSPGAIVSIDNISMGIIPESGSLNVEDIRSGVHNVLVSKEGFQSEMQLVLVYSNNTTFVQTMSFIQYGSLLITSEPSGAEAYLNGIRVGNTPVDARKMEIGEYFIKLQSKGYYDWEKTCTIEWNNHTEVSAKMIPKNEISPTPTPTQKSPTFTFIFTIISLVCMSFFIRRK